MVSRWRKDQILILCLFPFGFLTVLIFSHLVKRSGHILRDVRLVCDGRNSTRSNRRHDHHNDKQKSNNNQPDQRKDQLPDYVDSLNTAVKNNDIMGKEVLLDLKRYVDSIFTADNAMACTVNTDEKEIAFFVNERVKIINDLSPASIHKINFYLSNRNVTTIIYLSRLKEKAILLSNVDYLYCRQIIFRRHENAPANPPLYCQAWYLLYIISLIRRVDSIVFDFNGVVFIDTGLLFDPYKKDELVTKICRMATFRPKKIHFYGVSQWLFCSIISCFTYLAVSEITELHIVESYIESIDILSSYVWTDLSKFSLCNAPHLQRLDLSFLCTVDRPLAFFKLEGLALPSHHRPASRSVFYLKANLAVIDVLVWFKILRQFIAVELTIHRVLLFTIHSLEQAESDIHEIIGKKLICPDSFRPICPITVWFVRQYIISSPQPWSQTHMQIAALIDSTISSACLPTIKY
ncbi:hypothetical protein NEHOM01_0293 [Nematocida homosporus]|uniref:uncharacterized protein n=1 Tax=Nematocida homosporus TaxID=1912981 RepID=UPI00221E7BCD|nr:uncharacterized protein NEHOM01_0293 [Nematocida homosporus]KAI5184618.1 hypothetical protein NEHOM01_0293 [Nematocida homosporus]